MKYELANVVNVSRGNKRRVKRVVSDNKVGLAILGGAVTVLTIGAGVVGSVISNKKKAKEYKEKVDELETENQRLEAMLVNLSNDYLRQVGGEQEEFDDYEEYNESDEDDFEGIDFELLPDWDEEGVELIGFEYPDGNDVILEDELDKFNEFQQERAESLEKEGDSIVPPYEPQELLGNASDEEELNELDKKETKKDKE